MEQAEGNLWTSVPDLPGSVATASDQEAVPEAVRESIDMHPAVAAK